MFTQVLKKVYRGKLKERKENQESVDLPCHQATSPKTEGALSNKKLRHQ